MIRNERLRARNSHQRIKMTVFISSMILLFGSATAQSVFWSTHSATQIVTFQSTIIVPPLPADEWKTLFLWPGLSPFNKLGETADHYLPIDNGVLQPVLTFGDSCAPLSGPLGNIDRSASGWWISGFSIILNAS
jgi:hypothetical protein